MKERPILFSGLMVRAILEGRKTQTRRVVKNATGPFWDHPGYRIVMHDGFTFWETHSGKPNQYGPSIACPYGKPGDRLWVRETWWAARDDVRGEMKRDTVRYAATADGLGVPKFRPSIHMPRWASRITLEVVSVRVERLQDISEEDAKAEGIELLNGRYTFNAGAHESHTAVESFRALWESINGPGSWDSNPWLWVVEFKRITP